MGKRNQVSGLAMHESISNLFSLHSANLLSVKTLTEGSYVCNLESKANRRSILYRRYVSISQNFTSIITKMNVIITEFGVVVRDPATYRKTVGAGRGSGDRGFCLKSNLRFPRLEYRPI